MRHDLCAAGALVSRPLKRRTPGSGSGLAEVLGSGSGIRGIAIMCVEFVAVGAEHSCKVGVDETRRCYLADMHDIAQPRRPGSLSFLKTIYRVGADPARIIWSTAFTLCDLQL